MKYYIIAGEASGDLHGANCIKHLKQKDPQCEIRAWGGDNMRDQGVTIVRHINELAFMGFVEVAKNIRTILSNIKFCKSDILNFNPDAVIFIDYPGFNLRIARFCKVQGIKTIYYISPQIWAWHQSRIKAIRRDIDKMMVILPFEKEFFASHNHDVEFVGHPLLDAIEAPQSLETSEDFIKKNTLSSKPIIALLPGSRKQEIERMLPVMASIVAKFQQYQFVIAGTRAHDLSFYRKYSPTQELPVVYGETYALLKNSLAALVTSGTATLETAIIGTPQVVCYKTGTLSYQIARRLVKLKYISLVNLIMDEKVVTELIQGDLNSEKLDVELKKLTFDGPHREMIIYKYSELRKKLGGHGASEKAAEIIYNFSQKTS